MYDFEITYLTSLTGRWIRRNIIMEVSTTPTSATNAGITDGSVGGGNSQLTQAFDRAIAEAQQTLATTTVKGADLRALQQSAR